MSSKFKFLLICYRKRTHLQRKLEDLCEYLRYYEKEVVKCHYDRENQNIPNLEHGL